MKRFIIVLILILSAAVMLQARIINVPADYSTIQAGINISANGDTVLVQPAIYQENINFNGRRIVLCSLYLLNHDTTSINSTIIDGQQSGSVITLNHDEDSLAVISGLTIRNGRSRLGGGINCLDSSPIIRDNKISGNTAYYQNDSDGNGGGIASISGNPLIERNKFIGNSSVSGGGIWIGAGARIRDNIFVENNARIEGAGIFIGNDTESEITGNILSDNHAGSGGGISAFNISTTLISANTISGNDVNLDGAGMYLFFNNVPDERSIIVNDNSISDNIASGQGAGICIRCNYYGEGDRIFMISHNNISSNISGNGGGIYLGYGARQSVVEDNIINNNSASTGGGIYCLKEFDIKLNRIYGNNSVMGGGIYCERSNPNIIGNSIFQNRASLMGAGICCDYSPAPSIIGNLIYENDGNGIYCYESNPLIKGNVIFENTGFEGGGIYSWLSHATITNTILWDNNAPDGPQILLEDDSSSLISYNNIQGGWSGNGNISSNPLFRDPNNGDFHLMSTTCGDAFDSPCIDAGDPTIFDSILDCQHGLGTARSDMGAYGGQDSIATDIEIPIAQIPERFELDTKLPQSLQPLDNN